MNYIMCSSLIVFVHLLVTVSAGSLPNLSRGLFVIQGVDTCGQGEGYCLLDKSCSMDEDLEELEGDHHCEGLKHAFSPSPGFVCCKAKPRTTTMTEETGTTTAEQEEEPVDRIAEDNSTKHLKFLSPFNAAKKTNKLINMFSNVLPARTPLGKDAEGSIHNDKSLLNIILLGLRSSPTS